MKRLLGNTFFAIILSLILTVLAMNWLINGNPTKSFFGPIITGINNEAISSVDVEFNNKRINLNVHLSRALTCKQVIKTLGIQSFSIKEKKYAPTCSRISGELVIVTYNEVIST